MKDFEQKTIERMAAKIYETSPYDGYNTWEEFLLADEVENKLLDDMYEGVAELIKQSAKEAYKVSGAENIPELVEILTMIKVAPEEATQEHYDKLKALAGFALDRLPEELR